MKNNITLIGMPGSGKSTIGVVLAKAAGYAFIDSDLEIQSHMGMRLFEIMEQKGMDGFRQIEEEVNLALNPTKTIIATGGSAIYGSKAMRHFKEIGKVIYLKLPYEEISLRLGDLNERGVAVRPEQSLKDLYDERIPLYEMYADITIGCCHKDIKEIIAQIKELI